MSGSSLPAIQESANSSCSLLRSLAMNAPHSKVCSVTLTPTALRFDCITVAIATGDCIPEPDSGTHMLVVKPAGVPGVGQELPRACGVVGIGLEPGVRAPRAGQHRAGRHRA